jgi:arylsulfatase A-like enzyme
MSAPRPRHVIWISTDHMRYDCIGAHGNPAIHTPNLDRLVQGGVTLENCYGQNPLCMPSRASFMTGQYPCRTGVLCNGQELPPDYQPVAPQSFSSAGYETAQIGKLHLQCHNEMDLDPRPSADYGFNYMALSEEPGCYEDAYLRWLRAWHPEHERTMRVPRPFQRMEQGEEIGCIAVDAPAEVSQAGFVTSHTMQYLRNTGSAFVHAGIYAPHPPLNPPRVILEQYEGVGLPDFIARENEAADKPAPLSDMLGWSEKAREERLERRRQFYAMVTMLDSQVGRLLDDLESRGLLDETFILFMSDHGDMDGDHGLESKQPSYYDQVMHMPAVFHWPAGLPAGRRVTDMAENVDLLPTLCDLAGVPLDRRFQGRSLAPWLRGEAEGAFREDALAMHAGPGGDIWAMLRTRDAKYIRYGQGAEVLYDLVEDPEEFFNRAEDPAASGRLHFMRERLLQRMLGAATSTQQKHRPF